MGKTAARCRPWGLGLFVQKRNRNLLEAAGTTLVLIHHQAVYNIRMNDRHAVMGLVSAVFQSVMLVAGFLLMYVIAGVRSSPLRGDFLIFIMTGVFLFGSHVAATGAVSGSGAHGSGMTKHAPLNTAVLIGGAALASLYKQVLACFAILWVYHVLVTPVTLESWVGCLMMLLLAWGSGCAVGMVFLAVRPWWPKGAGVATAVYQRLNMVASGKMFVANTLPTAMFPYFAWNPLFHIIDQSRGYAFINYTPHRTSLGYALVFTICALMLGLMLDFVTRQRISLSWSAGK